MTTAAEVSFAPDRERHSGLYIHVPFCSVRCPFCNFSITTRLDERERWMDALETEMSIRAPEWPELFDTVYFGGGTPSLLTPRVTDRLLTRLRSAFRISSDAEVTIEMNPGDLAADDLGSLRTSGVNRLSLGVQSFDDNDLRFLGRDHTADASLRSFRDAREVGFDNVSVDLLWGLPLRTRSRWLAQIERAAELEPEHVSAYCLTYEPGTELTRRLEAGEFPRPTEGESAEVFLTTRQALQDAGYAQYEVSSFSRSERYRSRHNRKYWEGASYLGLGPSAHSYRDPRRFWNAPSVREYMRRIESGGDATAEEETLSDDQKRLERLFLSLRTIRGLSLDSFAEDFDADLRVTRRSLLDTLVREGLATIEGDRLSLTPTGLANADAIASRLR